MLEATMSPKLKFNLQSLTKSLPEKLWDDAYGAPEQKGRNGRTRHDLCE